MPSHPKKMVPSKQGSSRTFTVTCAIFGLIALGELLFMGFTIAARSGETREIVRQIEGDPIIVRVPVSESKETAQSKQLAPRSINEILLDVAGDYTPRLTPSITQPNLKQLGASPAIDRSKQTVHNPIASKHITDAENLHMKGDMMRALLKLEEAAKLITSNHPYLLYVKAIIHEDMGLWKEASDIYLEIYKQGTEAGNYYDIAAKKLSRGLRPIDRYSDVINLGQIITRPAEDRKSCQITIPIRKAPQHKITPEKVRIEVHFYDTSNGQKVEPASPHSKRTETWESMPIDWMGLGEEILHYNYSISENEISEASVYGQREYYGQVVELYYRDQLVDIHASPNTLHAKHAKLQQPSTPMFQPFNLPDFLPNINPDHPILPALPTR